MENQINTLPPIKNLFVESYHKLIEKLSNLILLNIFSFCVGIISLLILGGVGAYIAFSLGLFKLLNKLDGESLAVLSKINASTWVSFGILLAIFLVVTTALGFLSTIGPYLIIYQKENKLAIGVLIKRVFSLFLPLVLVGLISNFFVLGSFFFFFIPYFFVIYYLMFTQFEVIFEGKRGMSAVRASAQIVSQHFGEIFIRCLAYLLIYLLILMILPGIFKNITKEIGFVVSIITFILQWLFGLYGLVFGLMLYRQAKAATDTNKQTSIAWIVVISILGWIFFGLIAFLGFQIGAKYWKSGVWKKYLNKVSNQTQPKTKIYSYIPSNCGLSIPLPETYDSLTKSYRHWIYEERYLDKENFSNLAPVATSTEPVLGGFLAYKKEDQRYKQEDKTFINSYTGLNIYCTNNTQNWDFDKFVEEAKKNTKFKVTKNSGLVKWGKVKLYSIYLEGINSRGNYVKDSLYLGVTEDKKRIFFIRLWGVADNDPNKTQLISDIESIIDNLKYEEMTDEIDDPNQKAVVSTCKQYTIREGEFKSDKCYSQKDYDDLSYYLMRFNSAASSYNGAIASMEITCTGSEFFKNSCERAKQQKQQSETDMNNYRGIINGIIGRGK